ncbi:major facilitator superfamily domain-containing protein [Cyathus striatus]|nr:major facilitator superfamily domain-containing protein [Cyathus striatus]
MSSSSSEKNSVDRVRSKEGNMHVNEIEEEKRYRERSVAKSILLVTTVSFGMIVNSANSTATSLSLPTIGHELNVAESELQWLLSAYSLSSGCLLLVFGRLADLHGRKKTFLLGSLWLVAFTLACGFTNDITTLNVLRGIQGAGAAATIPASVSGAPIGAVVGNVIGGVLTQFTAKTWRSPFYFQTGLVFLCFIGGLVSIDKDLPSSETDRRVDWIGAFLVTGGLVLIVFVLGQGEIAPDQWKTPYIIALLIVGVILLVLFLFWQHRLEKLLDDPESREVDGWYQSLTTSPPLMRPSLWSRAHGKLAATMAIAFLNWCAFMAWSFWVQLYYQDYKQLSAIRTVVRLMPMMVSGTLCNVFVGVMAARVPMIYLMVIGTIGSSAACLLFAVIKENATYWAFGFPSTTISVIGADFVFSAGTLFIAKVALPHEQSVAGALFQTMTQLGTAVGITVSTVVFNRVTIKNGGVMVLASYQAAQWTCFAFGCIAIILALLSFRGVGVVGHHQEKSPDPERTATNSKEEGVKSEGEVDVKAL